MIPVRYSTADDRTLRTFDPLADDHPLVGVPCPACDIPFDPGDRVTLVYVGPGDDPDDQQRFRAGRVHTGAAVALHPLCAGIEETP